MYEHMLIVIYMTIGVFTLVAAFDIRRFRDLLWFLAWLNVAHGSIMAVDAYKSSAEHSHLIGDVPLTFGWGVVLAAFLLLTPRSTA